jgi:protein-L-isoaspartate O-methyltransferase
MKDSRMPESFSFADVHRQVRHLFPTEPCDVVDIGAGTGRDAAGFASLGHRVVAVEPIAELRTRAASLHPSQAIEWLDDSLPDLAHLIAHGRQFDVVCRQSPAHRCEVDEALILQICIASVLNRLPVSFRRAPVAPYAAARLGTV